jgi:hypothetical protein
VAGGGHRQLLRLASLSSFAEGLMRRRGREIPTGSSWPSEAVAAVHTIENPFSYFPNSLSGSFVNKGSGRAIYPEANMGHLADVQLGPCA